MHGLAVLAPNRDSGAVVLLPGLGSRIAGEHDTFVAGGRYFWIVALEPIALDYIAIRRCGILLILGREHSAAMLGLQILIVLGPVATGLQEFTFAADMVLAAAERVPTPLSCNRGNNEA